MENEIVKYHSKRSVLDFVFIDKIFEKDERELLRKTQEKHPNAIIFMPNSDLIADYDVKGIGGSVPNDWNEEVLRL